MASEGCIASNLARHLEQIAGRVLQADTKFAELRDGWGQTKEKQGAASDSATNAVPEREALVEKLRASRKGRALWRELGGTDD